MVSRVVLLAGAAVAGASRASACDCPRLTPVSRAIRREAPFIFEGQVVEILDRSLHITRTTPQDTTGETRPLGKEVVFQVTRGWSGVTTRRMRVLSDAGDCAFAFEPGHRYVVFAHRGARGRPTVSVCSRTSEADRAQAVLGALGTPRPLRRPRG